MKELSFDEIIDIIINNIEKYGIMITNMGNHKYKNFITLIDSKNIFHTRNKNLSHAELIEIGLNRELFKEIQKLIEKNFDGSKYIRFYKDKENKDCENIVIDKWVKDEKMWNFIKDFVRNNKDKIRKINITIDKINENSNVVRIGNLFIGFENKNNINTKFVFVVLLRRFYRGGVYILDDFDIVKELL